MLWGAEQFQIKPGDIISADGNQTTIYELWDNKAVYIIFISRKRKGVAVMREAVVTAAWKEDGLLIRVATDDGESNSHLVNCPWMFVAKTMRWCYENEARMEQKI